MKYFKYIKNRKEKKNAFVKATQNHQTLIFITIETKTIVSNQEIKFALTVTLSVAFYDKNNNFKKYKHE